MKLNKKVEIGVNVISVLRKKEGFVTASEIAPEVGTTVNFLEQIMRNLKNDGIVTVKRGKNGGYTLNKEKQEVTAFDIAKAVGKFSSLISTANPNASDRLSSNIENVFKTMKL